MLLELRVKDFGIIEEIHWCLRGGLNVVTGETGAGKSLVVEAVEAMLSGRVAEAAIRHSRDEARLEGVFDLPECPDRHPLRDLLAASGLDTGEETLVISCAARRAGRSLLHVNGRAVTRGLLRQIGGFLVDLHGQGEHLSLLSKKYQLDFLDAYAHALPRREEFAEKAGELRKTEQELKRLNEQERDRVRREEFLRFQVEEIEQAKLQDGEVEALERERNVLTSCEQLKELSYTALQAISGEEPSRSAASARDRLNEALQLLRRVVALDAAQQPRLAFWEETLYGIEEAARELQAYCDGLEFNPQRLEEIETRRELIRSLQRKYGPTVTEICRYLETAREELAGLGHSSARKAELEQARQRLREEMGKIAGALSAARAKAAGRLVTGVKRELHDLSMAQVVFEVALTRVPDAGGISLADGGTYAFSDEGVDVVEFLASTNPGEPLQPLARIASTGEISRFMLALKGVLSAADDIPVLIFDEIDLGVGGRSGEVIGRKLWRLAQGRQVICVTHLPQIAAFADAHYTVQKEAAGTRTLSRLTELEGEGRLQELAVMLAGPQVTATSLRNTRELVARAESWKQSGGPDRA